MSFLHAVTNVAMVNLAEVMADDAQAFNLSDCGNLTDFSIRRYA
jgi:hypothetical protein